MRRFSSKNPRTCSAKRDRAAEPEISTSAAPRPEGGDISIRSRSGIQILEDGRVETRSTAGSGGEVDLFVAEGDIDIAGKIVAEGTEGGGIVAARTFGDIRVPGRISADATQAGDGGEVSLDGTTVYFSGDISARGGPVSGDGGTVVFSTPNVIAPGAKVDVSAPNGDEGEFIH
jgi:hypothetical protein